jgi:hypothetical protein
MKIQKIFVIAAAMVTCAIAIPFAFPLQNNVNYFNSSSTMPSIILFLSIFVFMAGLGWVKRVQK